MSHSLSDIEKEWFRVTQKNFEILESPCTVELTDFSSNWKPRIIDIIPMCQVSPLF